jgi:hypothetical protein
MLEAAKVGPKEGYISVTLPVANTSTPIDLSAVLPSPSDGRTWVDIYCNGLLYYKFATSNANIVDDTATTGPTRCFARPSSIVFREIVPAGCNWLIIKTAGSQVRVSQSGEFRG